MRISPLDKIEENIAINIVNGRWTAYVIKDCISKELILYIPLPFEKYEVKKIDQNTTYRDLFPKDKYTIIFDKVDPLKVSKLPFDIGMLATDKDSIYEIINACNGYPLITMHYNPKIPHHNPKVLDEINIELRNLITDEIITKRLKDIHIDKKDEEFNQDLIHLMNSKDLAVKSYLKAAYLYSNEFKEKIDNAKK